VTAAVTAERPIIAYSVPFGRGAFVGLVLGLGSIFLLAFGWREIVEQGAWLAALLVLGAALGLALAYWLRDEKLETRYFEDRIERVTREGREVLYYADIEEFEVDRKLGGDVAPLLNIRFRNGRKLAVDPQESIHVMDVIQSRIPHTIPGYEDPNLSIT